MILEIKLAWSDYLSGIRLHLRPGPRLRTAGSGLVVLLLMADIYLVVNVFKNEFTVLSTFTIQLFFACLMSWYFLYLPYKAKKAYKQQASLQAPFSLELVADGLKYSSAIANAHLTWDYFPKWKENGNLILLYHSDDLFQMIPKSFFKGLQEMDSFRAALSANIKQVE